MHLAANEILSSEGLLRVALSQLIPLVAFVLLVEALYRLVTEADRTNARLMAAAATIALLIALLDQLVALAA